VVQTDVRLAKLVGMILHARGSAIDRLADAHVVAVCAAHDGAVVVTADPDDIAALPRCRGPASWFARQCHSGGDGQAFLAPIAAVPDSSGVGEVTERPKVIAC